MVLVAALLGIASAVVVPLLDRDTHGGGKRHRHPASTAAPANTHPFYPGSAAAGWRMVFDQEFNDDRLDPKYWSTGWFGVGSTLPASKKEPDCYSPENVTVSGGSLNLAFTDQPSTCGNGQHMRFTGAMVSTHEKYDFTYGFLEARIYLPADDEGKVANWPAFWTSSQHWPLTGEIDVLEGNRGLACHFFHSSTGAPGNCMTTRVAGGWHIFAARWQAGKISYFLDGRRVDQDTSGVTGAPMYPLFDYTAHNAVRAQPGTMRVDYFRIWQRPGG